MSTSNSSRGENATMATSALVAAQGSDKCRFENPRRSGTLHFGSDVLQIGLKPRKAGSVEQPCPKWRCASCQTHLAPSHPPL
jgi:hypothetical protein